MKQCTTCKEWKEPDDYNPDKRASDGKQSRCRKCSAAWLREYRVRAGISKTGTIRGERQEQRKPYDPESHRESSRKWRERNRDKHRQYNIGWRAKNKEHHKEYNAKWQQENIERCRILKQRYKDQIRQNGGSFTQEEFNKLCRKYNYRCAACGEQRPLASDHIIPVSKGGSSDIQNIQPLCTPCNSKKRDKVIDYRF